MREQFRGSGACCRSSDEKVTSALAYAELLTVIAEKVAEAGMCEQEDWMRRVIF